MVLSLIPDSGKSEMAQRWGHLGMDPRSQANRGWGWGWTPDPRQIGDGNPIPDPDFIHGDGDGDRGFRALPCQKGTGPFLDRTRVFKTMRERKLEGTLHSAPPIRVPP
jgi:hypothetical protein